LILKVPRNYCKLFEFTSNNQKQIIREKMKQSFQLIIILLFTLSLTNCGQNNDLKNLNPNSAPYKKLSVNQEDIEIQKMKELRVKSRKTYSKFSTKYIKGGGIEILVERINLDENGNKSEQFRYLSNGDVDFQWLYNYDYYERLTTTESYDGFQTLLSKIINEYDGEGYKNKSEEWSEKSKTYTTSKYVYDKNYNLLETSSSNERDGFLYKSEYKYTDSMLDSVLFLNNKNQLLTTIKIKYDSDKRKVGVSEFNSTGISLETEYKYDSNSNLIEIKNNKLSSFSYKYDAKGNVIDEIEYNSGGYQQNRFGYEYDSSTGLLVKKIRYDGENDPALLIRYEYEY